MPDEKTDQAYVDGHRAGYAKGRDDGIGIGYADAKLRAFNAVDALGDTGVMSKDSTAQVRQQLETAIGKRA